MYHFIYSLAKKVIESAKEQNNLLTLKREESYMIKAEKIEKWKEIRLSQLKTYMKNSNKKEALKKQKQIEKLKQNSQLLDEYRTQLISKIKSEEKNHNRIKSVIRNNTIGTKYATHTI